MNQKIIFVGSLIAIISISIPLAMYLNANPSQVRVGEYDGMPRLEQLQDVLDYCNDTFGNSGFIGYNYFNKTHHIDNIFCKWQKIEKFPNSDIDCIPGQSEWVTGEEYRNETHIYNKYWCLWEEDKLHPFGETGPEFNPAFCKSIRTEKLASTDTVENIYQLMEWQDYCNELGFTEPFTNITSKDLAIEYIFQQTKTSTRDAAQAYVESQRDIELAIQMLLDEDGCYSLYETDGSITVMCER